MKTPDAILNGKIIIESIQPGDGKRVLFIADTNNGWEDLKGEIDTDDCDSIFAKAWMNRIIKCVNACRGIENPVVSDNSK